MALSDEIANLMWKVRRRVPSRARAALRAGLEGALNAAPDGPFLAVRRDFAERVGQVTPVPPPPRLLRTAAYRRRVPASYESFEMLGRPGLRLTNLESMMTQVIFWAGDRWALAHSAGLDVWAALCERATAVVEVGANVGYYTVVGASAARGSYTAYEPHPRSSAALRANLELNGLGHVKVVEAAVVVDQTAQIELVCPVGADGAAPAGAMVRGSSLEDYDPQRVTESFLVDAVPFASVLEDADLLKIDVEGFESQLLGSARSELRAQKPALMLEIHDANEDLWTLVPQLLGDLDASLYAMRSDSLEKVSAPVLAKGTLVATYGTWDYLIVPSTRAALIDGLAVR